MIIEMPTYTLQPGTLAEVEKRFGEALAARERHSRLAAFWHTEVGPLNQIIHVWEYESLAHRGEVRAAATKEPGWPPSPITRPVPYPGRPDRGSAGGGRPGGTALSPARGRRAAVHAGRPGGFLHRAVPRHNPPG